MLVFEWNREKAEANNRKHGIRFEEACSIFGDPLTLTIRDPDHSLGENRFITIGNSLQGDLLIVIHVDRDDRIRIISARRATTHERKLYESGQR